MNLLQWTTVVGAEFCHVQLWPLFPALVGLLSSILMGVLLALRPNGPARKPFTFLALVGMGFLLLASVGGLLVVEWLFSCLSCGGTPAAAVMGRVMLLGWSLSAGAMLAIGIGLGVHFYRAGPADPAGLQVMLGAVLACLLAASGMVYSAVLQATGPLPELSLAGPARLHMGRSHTYVPSIEGEAFLRWRLTGQTLLANAPGTAEVGVRAQRLLVTIEDKILVEVGEDRGDPLLPLAVGGRWVYRRVENWRNQMLWFVADRGEAVGPQVVLQVTAASGADTADGPLHSYALDFGGESFTVFGWNGQWMLSSDEPSPFLWRLDEADVASAPAAPEGMTATPCRSSLFTGFTCQCLVTPAGQAGVPGPALCKRDRAPADDWRFMGSAMLAVLTAGMVILDADHEPRWVLESSAGGG